MPPFSRYAPFSPSKSPAFHQGIDQLLEKEWIALGALDDVPGSATPTMRHCRNDPAAESVRCPLGSGGMLICR